MKVKGNPMPSLFPDAPEIIIKDISDISFPTGLGIDDKFTELHVSIVDYQGQVWDVFFYMSNMFLNCKYFLNGDIYKALSTSTPPVNVFQAYNSQELVALLLDVRMYIPPAKEEQEEPVKPSLSDDLEEMIAWLAFSVNPDTMPDKIKQIRENLVSKYLAKSN